MAERLARGRELLVLVLHVTDLGHDHDLGPFELAPVGQVEQNFTDESLAATVGVVARGVDQVDARAQRQLERGALLRVLVVDAVTAEADAADEQAGICELVARLRAESLGASLRAGRAWRAR